MARRKTEEDARRIAQQFKETGDLKGLLTEACEQTAHYARCSGTIRLMFQQALLDELSGTTTTEIEGTAR